MNNIAKTINNTAYAIVLTYAYYDKDLEEYDLNINDVSAFEMQKLASLLMLQDKDRLAEATGPDNPAFEKGMASSLINYLGCEDDYNKNTFIENWLNGITSYFKNDIEALLEEKLVEFSLNEKYEKASGYI